MGAESLASPAPPGGAPADPAAGLSALVHALRQAGYRAGPSELVSAGRLLAVLARRDKPPTTAAELAPWLRPVFCSTREEQARFDEIFRSWAEGLERRRAAERALGQVPAGGDGSDAQGRSQPGAEINPWPERAARVLRVLAVIAVVAAIGWLVWNPWRTTSSAAPPAATAGAEPPGGAASAAASAPAAQAVASPATQPDLQGIYPAVREMRSLRPAIVWPLLALPLLLLLLSGGVPGLALIQGRHRSGREVVLDTTALAREAEQVLPGLDPSVAARLERHVRAEAGNVAPLARRRRLDARRTVEATLRRHGIVSPQYRAVPLRPSYLMLIDAEDEHDPRGRVFYLWAERMRRQGLMVDIRLFRHPAPDSPAGSATADAGAAVHAVQVARAPRCWRIGEAALVAPDRDTGIALDRLEDPPAGQRLVVISEAASWLEPDGRWRDWFVRARLRRWPQRVFFTPAELRDWGLPEERLETQEHAADPGFLVLPLDEAALGAWSTLLAAGSLPAFTLAESQRYPRVLAAAGFDPFTEPPPEVLDRLVAQLKIYLRDSGFRWLAALAVPPMCRWELTLLLGQALFDHRISRLAAASDAAAAAAAAAATDPLDAVAADTGEPWRVILGRSYRRLVRLPWLRGGRDAAGRVHAAGLPDWLRLRLLHELPTAVQEEIREIVGQLLSTLRPDGGAGLALGFEAPPQTSKDAGPASAGASADRLYLGYLSGLTPRQLALRLPGAWQEWLRNEPPPEPGWRARLVHGLRRIAERLQAAWARMRYEDGMPWARAFVLPIAAGVMLVAAGFVLWRLAEQPADQLAGGAESLLFERALRPVLPGDAKDWPTVALSPDGRWAIDQSRRLRGLRVWDTTSGRIVRRLPDLQVDAVIFDGPDRFTTCNLTGTVRHWNVRDGSRSNAGNDDDGRVDEVLSRGGAGNEAGSCSLGRGTAVWADSDGQAVEIRSVRSPTQQMHRLTDRETDSLIVSPNGRWFVSRRASSAPNERAYEIAAIADLSLPPAGTADLEIDGPMAWAGDTLGAVLGGRNGDASLKLWDIGRGGFFELPLDGLRNPSSLALSADARYALVGAYGGELVLWDVERRRELMRRVAGLLAVRPLWISDDAGTAIAGVGDRGQTLWQAWQAWQPPQARTALPAVAVAVSADGRRAAFAAADGRIEITDAAQRQVWGPSSALPTPKLQGLQRLLAFSADGRRFAAAGESGGVTIWPTPVGRPDDAPGVSAATDAPLVHLAYTGDGQRLIGVSRIGSIYEWRAANGGTIGVASGSPSREVLAVAMRDDGLLAISVPGGTAGGGQTVEVRSREQVQRRLTVARAWRETKLQFLADRQRLAMSERVESGEWDLPSAGYTAHPEAPATRSTGMQALRDDRIDAQGQWRATVSARGALQVWNLRSGAVAALPEVPSPVAQVRWTNAGTLVVASASGAVSVWDPVTARSIAVPLNLGAAPAQIVVSADGSRLVATPFSETIVPPAAESNDAPPPAAQQQQAQQQTQQAKPLRKSKQAPIESNAPAETNAPSPAVSPAAPTASSPPAAAPAGPLPQAGWWALFADEPPQAAHHLLDERLHWPVAPALLLIGLLLPAFVLWRERRHAQRLRTRLQPLAFAAPATAAPPAPAAAAAA